MKKLYLVVLASSILSGCIFTAQFDSVEYSYVTQLRTASVASKEYCNDSIYMKMKSQQLYETSLGLLHYSEYLPRNEPTFLMAKEIHEIVEPLKNRYHSGISVSEIYCKNKMDNIIDNAITMQKSINKRSR